MALDKFILQTLLALSSIYSNGEASDLETEGDHAFVDYSDRARETCFVQGLNTFLRERKLCDKPDTEMTPLPSDIILASSTCANRCGSSKAYGSFLTCACDVKCAIYKDCCDDMYSHCVNISARAAELAAQLQVGYSICDGELLSISSNSATFHSQVSIWHTRSTEPPTRSPSNAHHGPLANPELKINDIFENFYAFKVADTQLGVIFHDYLSYRLFGRSAKKMAFVPKLITLACTKSTKETDNKGNILKLLPTCSKTAIQNIPTVYHRSCKWQGTVFCHCAGEFKVEGNLSDVCFHQNQLRFHLLSNKQQLLTRELSSYCHFNNLLSYAPTEVYESQVDTPLNGEAGNLRGAVSLSLIQRPIVSYDKLSTAKLAHDDIFFTDIDSGTTIGSTLSTQRIPSGILPLEWVVESTETLEKRLRCGQFDSPLSDCRLEACTKGVFLMAKPLSPWNFKGRMCMLPGIAIVKSAGTHLELCACSCFRVLSVLDALKVWRLRAMASRDNECVLQLIQLSQDNKNPVDTIYNFSDSPSRPSETPFLGEMSFQRLMGKLAEQMKETRGSCGDLAEETFDVCFYIWSADAPKEKELATCVRLSAGSDPIERINRILLVVAQLVQILAIVAISGV